MTAKPVAESVHQDVLSGVQKFKSKTGRAPMLAVVLVGDDPGSVIYTSRKGETAVKLGMNHETFRFPANVNVDTVKTKVMNLNADPNVDGILIQRPLPKNFKEEDLIRWVDPDKDVDGFHPENIGRLSLGLPSHVPCTPLGVMRMLDHYKVPVFGKIACIVGRSVIVGKPMAALLLKADATVIHCHSKTPDLAHYTKQADLLVVAIGRANAINHSHVKPGAYVVDVGINRTPSGQVVGDVDQASMTSMIAGITPVPGGVGPMTIAMLMSNTLNGAMRKHGIS